MTKHERGGACVDLDGESAAKRPARRAAASAASLHFIRPSRASAACTDDRGHADDPQGDESVSRSPQPRRRYRPAAAPGRFEWARCSLFSRPDRATRPIRWFRSRRRRHGCANCPRSISSARQQLVLRAFDGMRHSRRPVDLARAQALQYVDAALGADRRQLFKQYVESLESAPKVSERIWQASLDLAQGFIIAYQDVLETALAPAAHSALEGARADPVRAAHPLLRHRREAARLPSRALDSGQVDRAAPERTCARASSASIASPTSLGATGGNGTQWTVEQEYVYALLLHQLNSGNLSPANLDWAAAQIRALEPHGSSSSRCRRRWKASSSTSRAARACAPNRPGFGRDAALSRHDAACRASST